MKSFLRIGMRLILFLLLLLFFVLVSFAVLTIIFIVLREVVPWLKVPVRLFQVWSFSLLCLLAMALYIWSLAKPTIYLLGWLKQLAQGSYTEPPRTYWLGKSSSRVRLGVPYTLFGDIIGQLSVLTEALRQSENARQELDENRKHWIAGIRHDLKTPLAYIRGYSSMIAAADKYSWSIEEIRHFGSLVEQKTVHVEQLIEDLNDSYQFDGGEPAFHREDTEMVDFIRQIVTDIADNPVSEQYTFAFDTDRGEYRLAIGRRLLQRALHNLIWNAVVHNPAGSSIQTELRCRSHGLTILIKDNGRGIDDETLIHLNGDEGAIIAPRTERRGNGMGMALAKEFITKHNGTMSVQSELHKGTAVTIFLPA